MSDEEVYEIKRLDLDNLVPKRDPDTWSTGGGIYLAIGPSGSGKSVILKNMLQAKSEFIPVALVVSETEDVNHTFSPHVPDLFIYSKMSADIISRLQNRQTVASQYLPNAWATLILDDCMNKTSTFREEALISLFKISRHSKLFGVVSCQYSLDLGPVLRDQCAGFFILRNSNEANRDRIYKNFGSIIPNRRLFDALMDKLTTDYCCMYIDNRCRSDNWLDAIYWYQAESKLGDWSAVSLDVEAYSTERRDTNYNSLGFLLKQACK